MRYQMGPVELIGWMILGAWLGFVLCSLATNALELLLKACRAPLPSLGYGGGAFIFFLFIVAGAGVPIVIYGRGKRS